MLSTIEAAPKPPHGKTRLAREAHGTFTWPVVYSCKPVSLQRRDGKALIQDVKRNTKVAFLITSLSLGLPVYLDPFSRKLLHERNCLMLHHCYCPAHTLTQPLHHCCCSTSALASVRPSWRFDDTFQTQEREHTHTHTHSPVLWIFFFCHLSLVCFCALSFTVYRVRTPSVASFTFYFSM